MTGDASGPSDLNFVERDTIGSRGLRVLYNPDPIPPDLSGVTADPFDYADANANADISAAGATDDGTIESYSWSGPDGTILVDESPSASNLFDFSDILGPGDLLTDTEDTVDLTLTAVDDEGASSSRTLTYGYTSFGPELDDTTTSISGGDMLFEVALSDLDFRVNDRLPAFEQVTVDFAFTDMFGSGFTVPQLTGLTVTEDLALGMGQGFRIALGDLRAALGAGQFLYRVTATDRSGQQASLFENFFEVPEGEAPVPAPATAGLVLAALAGLFGARRTR